MTTVSEMSANPLTSYICQKYEGAFGPATGGAPLTILKTALVPSKYMEGSRTAIEFMPWKPFPLTLFAAAVRFLSEPSA
jgi:hypothetical protein